MKKILLVHDAAFFLRMGQTILRREDVSIFTATDGHEALRLAREHRPDLVVLDDALSSPAALEICRQLRQDTRTSNTSILVSVSRSNRGSLNDFLQAGANDYVIKPVNRLLFNQRATSLLNVPARRFLRTMVKVEIQGLQDDKPFFGTTVNLSETGLMIETRRPLEVGCSIAMQFFLPGESEPLQVQAEVVRGAGAATSSKASYGLRFSEISTEDRDRIRDFVAREVSDNEPACEEEAPLGDAPESSPVWEPPTHHLPA